MRIRVCPKCHSLDVHRSHRGPWESLSALLFVRPYRCSKCRLRFWGSAFANRAPNIEAARERDRVGHEHEEMGAAM